MLQKLRYIKIQSEKLHSNITEDQLNDFLVQEFSVRIQHSNSIYLDF